MPIDVKICGLSTAPTLQAAIDGGAAYVGFNFYPPSPRAVTAAAASGLAASVPAGVVKTALFVDPSDDDLAAVLEAVPIDLLQLHGGETPARVAEIRQRFARPVMKVIKLRAPTDLAAADGYLAVADRLMFDAKPPADLAGALPGGNAISFDWHMLAGRRWPLPWMLAGGLTAANLAEAVAVTGADTLDVSSGVETAPGQKDPALIAGFLAAAKAL
ncbi:MAG TPA: phosphoribosylanthranilate isomerase [Kiloniellaceae bacterium]|nr:phosphoribosylanthranilate isomerase [Kiloniellaceae bacterium]